MHFGEILSIITLGLGALMGLGAMFSPSWASGVVRLVADPNPDKPGGYAEFRATYGGLFLFSHLMTLALLLTFSKLDTDAAPIMGLVAVMPLAAGWVGAGIGRLFSLIMDRSNNRANGMNPTWIAFEIVFGLAIAAPFLQFL